MIALDTTEQFLIVFTLVVGVITAIAWWLDR